MNEQFDIAIIGGGPSGSTVATLLAKKGYSVLIVEQEKFPRYHIGESTVPGILQVLEELGIQDEVEQHGYVPKNGITLVWGKEATPWSVFFKDGGSPKHAFQVVRSDFDSLLLNNARRSGVQVLEETRVVDVLFDGERCTGLKYVIGNNGEETSVTARFVIDASGQNALLARKKGLLEWDNDLKNVAIWAYYQGGKNLDGEAAGNILVEATDNGWLWVIPLHDGTQSVGLVTPANNVKGRQHVEGMLLDTIANSSETKRLLAPARKVSGFHTARDWSYRSKRFYGPGFLLTGDAAGFIDPLFSTGVFLAMNGGSLAAKTVDALLKEPGKEAELFEKYQASYVNFFDTVISFVHFFYDPDQTKEHYWEQAQLLVDPFKQWPARKDFIRLISGLAGGKHVMKLDAEEKATSGSRP